MFKPRIMVQRLRIWYPVEVLTVLCLFVGLHCGLAYSSTGANNMFVP